jgi:hypothetical protein
MTTSTRVWMPSLVNIMSTRQQKELNVVEGSACNCFCPMWKLASHTMVAKVLWIASWVLVRSMPWAQHKRWIHIKSMRCVHTHQRMPTIKRWGNLSHIHSVVKKIGEDNRKVGKTSWIVSKAFALGPKHDKIWAQWASNISSKNMSERVWWCKHSEMESWSWTVCCLMSCPNGGCHACMHGLIHDGWLRACQSCF